MRKFIGFTRLWQHSLRDSKKKEPEVTRLSDDVVNIWKDRKDPQFVDISKLPHYVTQFLYKKQYNIYQREVHWFNNLDQPYSKYQVGKIFKQFKRRQFKLNQIANKLQNKKPWQKNKQPFQYLERLMIFQDQQDQQQEEQATTSKEQEEQEDQDDDDDEE